MPEQPAASGQPGTSEALVRMEGIDKAFPGVRALDQCQFELRAGEVHALVGENGAGKSTLMKVLAGVYAKDAGRILHKGEEVEIASPRAAQHLGISMIHQELNLMPHLTVAQNIFIGREPRKRIRFLMDERKINEQARQLLDLLHLNLDPRSRVADLTVAKQQMVEIAKALSFNSEVLIMDEPTAALTDTEIRDLFRIIRQLRDKGVGVVHISHRLEELKQISDRITVMRDGRYVDTVATADAAIDQIIRMMVGRTIYGGAPEIPENPSQEVVLEVRHLKRGQRHQGRQLPAEAWRDPRLRRAGGRRADGGGARHLRRGSASTRARSWYRARKVAIRKPTDAVRHGIGYLSEDRKRYGLTLGMDVETNVVLAALEKFLRYLGWVDTARTRATGRALREGALHPDAQRAAEGQEPLRRQPAEGGHRQVADRRHPRPHLRRADARHRRGREERDLPPAQRPGAPGQVHHHDLVGAARDPAHEPPHPGHVRRPDHGRARTEQLPRKTS